jgi:DNA repair exonuclease SbcCD ATPase subunit
MTKATSSKNKPEGQKDEKESAVDLASPSLAKGQAGEKDSVDRIRDILFGAQVRQYDQRFHGVEETIKNEISKLRDDTKKANETLEHYAKKGLESLTAQIKAEQKERSDSNNDLSKTLDSLNKALEKKINRLEETTNAGRLDLQEQILQQSKKLLQEIQQLNTELTAALKKAVQELRKEKADRLALGNLFNEIGLRLKEEFKLPDVK